MRQFKITKQIMDIESYSTSKYLSEVSKIKILQPEEEAVLARLAKSGDKRAYKELILRNLRFVVSVAKQYRNQGLSLGDLISVGNMGLLKTMENFDDTKGFKFISYAVWWIRREIVLAIMEYARLVRLPQNRHADINKISKCYYELEQKSQWVPSSLEIADSLDVSVEFVNESISMAEIPLSLDLPLSRDQDNVITLHDIFSSQDDMLPQHEVVSNKESLQRDVERVLKTLTPKECVVITRYFGLNDGQSVFLEKIAAELAITTERVRQLKRRAIRKLSQTKGIEYLKEYL